VLQLAGAADPEMRTHRLGPVRRGRDDPRDRAAPALGFHLKQVARRGI